MLCLKSNFRNIIDFNNLKNITSILFMYKIEIINIPFFKFCQFLIFILIKAFYKF